MTTRDDKIFHVNWEKEIHKNSIDVWSQLYSYYLSLASKCLCKNQNVSESPKKSDSHLKIHNFEERITL
jgi:hypothetical protein